MRAIFGVLSLVVVLLVVVVLAKKQLTATQQAVPVLTLPAAAGPDGARIKPDVTPQPQAQEVQQQYKQAIDNALQQPRVMPDDK